MAGSQPPSPFGHAFHAPIRKLKTLAPLSRAEVEALSAVMRKARPVHAGERLLLEGEEMKCPILLVSGWAYSLRMLPGSRRQVTWVFVPGDAIGLLRRPRPRTASTVFALTDALVADASGLLDQAGPDHQGLKLACLRAEALEQACLLDHIVRLGRQSAHERVVHFLFEMQTRLGLVGEVDGKYFSLPLTQQMLADTLGLSVVHINRTLKWLRRENLAGFQGGLVSLDQPAVLARMVSYVNPVERRLDFLPTEPLDGPLVGGIAE